MIRALALLLCLAACMRAPLPDSDPLLFAPEDVGRAKSVVIGIPGALTSIEVLYPIEAWRTDNRTIAYYRLPGFNDHPVEAPLSIDLAASRLATFVRDGDFEQVYFVGHSTGAAIALETAKALRRVRPEIDVHIAGISTALPAPQPFLAGVRSAGGTLSAAARVGSLDPRTVWLEYYRRLSYGPDVSRHAEIAAAADILVTNNDDRIQLPREGLGPKHFLAILGWQNPAPETLKGVDMVFWHGAVDPVFPPAPVSRFVERLPDAELRLLQDQGHVILLTYPRVWDEIRAHWALD